jgi:uncharacterized protein (DUF2252 family)
LRFRDKDEDVETIDAAYWRKGRSSLGKLSFAVLFGLGKGRKTDFCLVDRKEAIRPPAPR